MRVHTKKRDAFEQNSSLFHKKSYTMLTMSQLRYDMMAVRVCTVPLSVIDLESGKLTARVLASLRKRQNDIAVGVEIIDS